MVKRVVVGVDGSEPSRKAARFALELARQTGACLQLVMVLHPPHALPFMPMEGFAITERGSTPEELAQGNRLLEQLTRELPAGQVETQVLFGEPAEVLVEQARAVGADLLIVGARGMGPASRWLMGSVSDRVVHHAPCAVTVVR